MKPEIKIAILVAAALLTWGGIFLAYRYLHNPQRKAQVLAEKALYVLVEHPGSVKVLAISKPDSVYGREYVTQEEQMGIAQAMMKVNGAVMKATDGFEHINPADKRVSSLMERQMSAMSALRSLIRPEEGVRHTRPPFSGWKVKVDYQAKAEDGTAYRSELWLFLDKEATCVVKSFEIPII